MTFQLHEVYCIADFHALYIETLKLLLCPCACVSADREEKLSLRPGPVSYSSLLFPVCFLICSSAHVCEVGPACACCVCTHIKMVTSHSPCLPWKVSLFPNVNLWLADLYCCRLLPSILLCLCVRAYQVNAFPEVGGAVIALGYPHVNVTASKRAEGFCKHIRLWGRSVLDWHTGRNRIMCLAYIGCFTDCRDFYAEAHDIYSRGILVHFRIQSVLFMVRMICILLIFLYGYLKNKKLWILTLNYSMLIVTLVTLPYFQHTDIRLNGSIKVLGY